MACSGKVVADIEYMKEIFCMYMPCFGCEFPFVAKVVVDIKCIQVSLVVVVNSLQVDLSTFLFQVLQFLWWQTTNPVCNANFSSSICIFANASTLCQSLIMSNKDWRNPWWTPDWSLQSVERMKKVKALFHNLFLQRSHLTLRWQEELHLQRCDCHLYNCIQMILHHCRCHLMSLNHYPPPRISWIGWEQGQR